MHWSALVIALSFSPARKAAQASAVACSFSGVCHGEAFWGGAGGGSFWAQARFQKLVIESATMRGASFEFFIRCNTVFLCCFSHTRSIRRRLRYSDCHWPATVVFKSDRLVERDLFVVVAAENVKRAPRDSSVARPNRRVRKHERAVLSGRKRRVQVHIKVPGRRLDLRPPSTPCLDVAAGPLTDGPERAVIRIGPNAEVVAPASVVIGSVAGLNHKR